MINKLSHEANIYTDLDALEKLRYQAKRDPQSAKKEVSKQFEALLMQILLRSMREANKSFTSDLFGGDQMQLYQDLLDKQMTLVMSQSGMGIAEMIEQNIDNQSKIGKANASNYIPQTKASNEQMRPATSIVNKMPVKAPVTQSAEMTAKQPTPPFNSQEDFVQTLWSSAKQAAKVLGVDPKILLAQAALETNWGKKVITNNNSNDSSHNLFNIKADNSWNKNTTIMDTLEQKNGVLIKEKASFRSYDSFKDSFADYAHFLKNNGRYETALNKANDPKQFVQALQEAGFATDSQYADKIFNIFTSKNFKNITDKMQ